MLRLGILVSLAALFGEPIAQASEASRPVLEQPEAARYVLLNLFLGRAVYEDGHLLHREIIAIHPSTYGLPPDHPLIPLFLYQKKLFDTHERLRRRIRRTGNSWNGRGRRSSRSFLCE